jgi:hypothetical protein
MPVGDFGPPSMGPLSRQFFFQLFRWSSEFFSLIVLWHLRPENAGSGADDSVVIDKTNAGDLEIWS